MSVIKGILFYSKHDIKSYKLKNMVTDMNIDIDTVCVDSKEIRDLLLQDDKYNITEVPSILLLYSSGHHKVYTGMLLEQWFTELLQNLQKISQPEPVIPPPESYTPIDFDEPPQQNVPKALRRSHVNVQDTPQQLRPPGRVRQYDEDDGLEVGGMGNLSGVQASLVNGHIMREKPDFEEDTSTGSKEIKKQGLSANEIAKQMQEFREKHDEQIDKDRPFM
jgi:hypothetical protein